MGMSGLGRFLPFGGSHITAKRYLPTGQLSKSIQDILVTGSLFNLPFDK